MRHTLCREPIRLESVELIGDSVPLFMMNVASLPEIPILLGTGMQISVKHCGVMEEETHSNWATNSPSSVPPRRMVVMWLSGMNGFMLTEMWYFACRDSSPSEQGTMVIVLNDVEVNWYLTKTVGCFTVV